MGEGDASAGRRGFSDGRSNLADATEEKDLPARAEFTVEPFEEGNPGPHVQAAIEALAPLAPDIGPFGTAVEGEIDEVFSAMGNAVRAAMDAGATRVSVNMTMIQ